MNEWTLERSLQDGSTAKVRFADAEARAMLVDHLELLCHPASHEGPDVKRVKASATRTVWRCRLNGRGYYLKHYHSPSRLRGLGESLGLRRSAAAREMRHSRIVAGCGVSTPQVAAIGHNGGRAWLVSREVAQATPLDLWHERQSGIGGDNAAGTGRVLIALADLVGRLHAGGVVHRDLHTGNILLSEHEGQIRLFLIDLPRVWYRRRLSRRARTEDLAKLMHDRLHVTTRSQRLAFLKRYLQVTDGPGSVRGWAAMVEHLAQAHKDRLYAARDRRVMRSNKYFTPLRLPGGWQGHAVLASKRRPHPSSAAKLVFSAADWQAALDQPHRLFDAADAVTVKNSNSSLVVRRGLTVGEHVVDVFLKRFRRNQPHKALLDMFRGSRALRAFRLGHALLTHRIATALPLAALERRRGPFFLRDSILIAEAVAPAEPVNQFLERCLGHHKRAGQGIDPARGRRAARDVLMRLGRLLRRLHDDRFAHRDFKAGNVLVRWMQDRRPEIVLVDLDGVSRRRRLSQRRMFQGVMRLNVSLLECPSVTHTDRLRMLLGYLRRPGSGRVDFKAYWRQLHRWSENTIRRQIVDRRRKQKKRRR